MLCALTLQRKALLLLRDIATMPLEQDSQPIADAVVLLEDSKGVLGKVMTYDMPDHVLNCATEKLEQRIMCSHYHVRAR